MEYEMVSQDETGVVVRDFQDGREFVLAYEDTRSLRCGSGWYVVREVLLDGAVREFPLPSQSTCGRPAEWVRPEIVKSLRLIPMVLA